MSEIPPKAQRHSIPLRLWRTEYHQPCFLEEKNEETLSEEKKIDEDIDETTKSLKCINNLFGKSKIIKVIKAA